jgi:TatD DNase family protein
MPKLIDSHCHLNQLDNIEQALTEATANDVAACLCVCITREDVPILYSIANKYPQVSISVGIHPNEPMDAGATRNELVAWGQAPRVIAIGETGLDYYHIKDSAALEHQRWQFRQHIHAARELGKPLIIHTRAAAEDTLTLMQEEQAQEVGGVMHCFTESFDIARRAMDLNFYISFSGILTFKNALQLHDVAKRVPLDRILIETDSPYLAPVPFRGKPNHPALVKYVAYALAELRNESYETIAQATTANFYRCFASAIM